MLLNRAVIPTLMDMLDQPDNVDMVLPSVLAVIELLSPDAYNSFVRHQIKKLFNSTTSVQVQTASLSCRLFIYSNNDSDGDNGDDIDNFNN